MLRSLRARYSRLVAKLCHCDQCAPLAAREAAPVLWLRTGRWATISRKIATQAAAVRTEAQNSLSALLTNDLCHD
jgi:hypothetical protein